MQVRAAHRVDVQSCLVNRPAQLNNANPLVVPPSYCSLFHGPVCVCVCVSSQAFFAQIYSEAQGSQAAPGHHALAGLGALGRIVRHYTLNIDGLAEAVGMSTWHHENNNSGLTVEMHGNIRYVCLFVCVCVCVCV